MSKDQILQLRQAALSHAARVPGVLLDNAELIYQWLVKDQQEQKAKQVAKDQ